MVSAGPLVEPDASFVRSRAEILPFADCAFDLISAAGSLNYVDLDRFWPEARRVLSDEGSLLVYDFSQGRSFPHSTALDNWFAAFMKRYPAPAGHARHLDPETIAALPSGFQVRDARRFEIPLPMSPSAYVDYAMTETNVAHAIAQGVPEAGIRAWCSETIDTAFAGGRHEVLFRGYFVVLTPRACGS
jgi:SAM-dependent methyltransferase